MFTLRIKILSVAKMKLFFDVTHNTFIRAYMTVSPRVFVVVCDWQDKYTPKRNRSPSFSRYVC